TRPARAGPGWRTRWRHERHGRPAGGRREGSSAPPRDRRRPGEVVNVGNRPPGGRAPAQAVLAAPFVVCLAAVFFVAVFFAAVFLAAVFLVAAFLAGAFLAPFLAVFFAGPLSRRSCSSSAARSRVISSTESSLRSVALYSRSVTYSP